MAVLQHKPSRVRSRSFSAEQRIKLAKRVYETIKAFACEVLLSKRTNATLCRQRRSVFEQECETRQQDVLKPALKRHHITGKGHL